MTEPPTDTKSAATLENHHHQAQNPSSALTTLWQTLARFKQAQQPAFATAGTLLGLERTGSLLPNDKDIDIGIDWLHMNDAVNLLQQNGWQEWQRSYDLINPRCFKNADGLVVDLCGYATEQTTQTVVSGLWMDKVPFEWNRITVFPAITLTQRNSPAGRVWHLKQPQTFLNALYGEDWSTPDPTFDTIVCAHNLRRFSWLAQCYAYSRLYQHLKQRRYAKALSQTRCIRRHRPEDPLLQQLQKQLETLTSQKADRVLALGYFDLIHIGHLNYLNYAKQQGQTLVVGVAPDAFSQQSKGYSPVLPESQRLKMVAAL
ncbi:MAG: adenylyltransferase/cytidyltransferase family protein, partial [Hydrogenovibrio sp.]